MKFLSSKLIFFVFFVIVSVTGNSAFAHGFQAGDLYIKHPYATPTPATGKNGAVYFKSINNSGKTADQLISAKTTVADRIEIHEMKMDGDVMKMRPLSSIDIPAGAEVSFAKGNPNGYHLMLMGLKRPLKDGDKFSVWLTFKKGAEVEVEVWVQSSTVDNQDQEHKH